jgi:ATP-dependent DNA helicase RecQ
LKNIHQILKEHWGFAHFRPLQEDIINSVLSGKDTLALLPTGGGKSVCFQVPALATEGICIVVSPLIALMKDQVMNLNIKGIKAVAIYSGMNYRTIDTTLDNCVYGHYKFLYVSPERLLTDDFKARLPKMNVNLLAIDEAHCISQWGYDFRPPYLKIADTRQLIPHVPVIALTATATPEVVEDIQDKLLFKQKNVLKKSFVRSNLSYVVRQSMNKEKTMLEVLSKVPGSAVVYVRNRRRTKEVASLLIKNGIKTTYYHAGLSAAERSKAQEDWIKNKTRVVCCTNAFGMGIDKPDVRTVIHLEPPDTLEAYFQEAGRAGRDEKKAYGVLLVGKHDADDLHLKIDEKFPDITLIKDVFDKLCSYLRISYHTGINQSFDFDFHDFSETYSLKSSLVHSVLEQLAQQDLILLNETSSALSSIRARASKETLHRFQEEQKSLEPIIKFILRTCGGVFEDYVQIEEEPIAKRLKISVEECVAQLQRLHKFEIFDYKPRKEKPQIIFLQNRYTKEQIPIDAALFTSRKKTYTKRIEAVTEYISNNFVCRSVSLVRYFGETNASACGICDVCVAKKKSGVTEIDFNNISNKISITLKENPLAKDALINELNFKKELSLQTIDFLTDIGRIEKNENGKLRWIE